MRAHLPPFIHPRARALPALRMSCPLRCSGSARDSASCWQKSAACVWGWGGGSGGKGLAPSVALLCMPTRGHNQATPHTSTRNDPGFPHQVIAGSSPCVPVHTTGHCFHPAPGCPTPTPRALKVPITCNGRFPLGAHTPPLESTWVLVAEGNGEGSGATDRLSTGPLPCIPSWNRAVEK